MPDLDHLWIDGTTYDLKDSTAREKDAVQDNELSQLKSALNADENLQSKTIKTDLEDWTLGRITSTTVTPSNYYAFSKTYALDGATKTLYFDDTKYKLMFAYYDSATNDPTTDGYDAISSWFTESPAVVPSSISRSYYRCCLNRLINENIDTSTLSVYYKTEESSLLVSTVNQHTDDISDLYDQIGKGSINPGTNQTGYYSDNDGKIQHETQASSSAYEIDLTDYIGHAVNVRFATTNGSSGRLTALCDDEDNIADSFMEASMSDRLADSGYNFYPTAENKTLYISFSSYGSGLVVTDYFGVYKEIENIKSNTSPYVCYVDGSVASTGDGSAASPFKTIQEGVSYGSNVIKVRAEDGNGDAIEYGAFSVSGRNHPLTIMPMTIPDYVSSPTYKELPKIYIKDTITYNGIDIRDSANVTLIDIWVDGSPRYNFNLKNIQHLEMIRCYANDNATANFSTFRYVNVNGVIRDCVAWNSQQDGFNIHGYGDTQFINCVGYNCGDDGISHHDSCTGCIIGGEYYGNGKAGIASPYGGARVDVSGAYCHDNTRYGLYADSDDSHPSIYARVSDCLFVDNAQADVYVADGIVISWNTLYKTKSIQATATFTEYNNTILP